MYISGVLDESLKAEKLKANYLNSNILIAKVLLLLSGLYLLRRKRLLIIE